MDAVREKLIELEKQYNEISDQLISDEVISNPRKITKLSKEQAQLSGSVEAWHELQELDSRIMQAEEMLTEEDPEMKEMAQLELDECVPEREALLEKIQKMLIPRDPEDGNDVIMEIRGGAGGDEGNIFAGDLYRMYTRYAESQGWKVQVMEASVSEAGGFSQIVFSIKGTDVYKALKWESGVHRVQRVPKTETQGRIHTSTATVLCQPEIEEEDFTEGGILHFCSVSLIDAPIKEAHKKAIEFAKKHNCLISFDPNVRLPLWETPEACRKAILEFLPLANIVKISDEELEFITGISDEPKALEFLLQGDVEVIIYTKGTNGAEFITKERKVFSPSFRVQAQDTTGAGDSFIGSFLYQVAEDDNTLESLVNLSEEKIKEILTFSNATAALTVCKRGAIGALPTKEEVLALAQGR